MKWWSFYFSFVCTMPHWMKTGVVGHLWLGSWGPHGDSLSEKTVYTPAVIFRTGYKLQYFHMVHGYMGTARS